MKLFTLTASAIALAFSVSATIVEPAGNVETLTARGNSANCVKRDDVDITISTQGEMTGKVCNKFFDHCNSPVHDGTFCAPGRFQNGTYDFSVVQAHCIVKSKTGKLISISEKVAKKGGLKKSGGGKWSKKAIKICEETNDYEPTAKCRISEETLSAAKRPDGTAVADLCRAFKKECNEPEGPRQQCLTLNVHGHPDDSVIHVQCHKTFPNGDLVDVTQPTAAKAGLKVSGDAGVKWDLKPRKICDKSVKSDN